GLVATVVVQVPLCEQPVVGRDGRREWVFVVEVVGSDRGHHRRATDVPGGKLLTTENQYVAAQPGLDRPLRALERGTVGGATHHGRVGERLDVDAQWAVE